MKKCKGRYTLAQLYAAIHKHGALATAARALGLNQCTMRGFINNNGTMPELPKSGAHSLKPTLKRQIENFKPIAGGQMSIAERETLKGTRFVFTCAQNNTHINKKFWAALQVFCKHNKAKLYVSRFAYNKSGFQNAIKEGTELWYAKEILPFVCDKSVSVAGGLVFSGELDILPTASDPLSGFESYAGYNSNIIPHVKVALKSLPRLKGELPRFLYTTGTVTQRNYVQRKAGQKAEFHHVYGALYVEVDKNGYWFARQLIADNSGAFHDLQTKYDSSGISQARVEAINYGDIHVEKADEDVSIASWIGDRSMLGTLRPRYQFIHDLTDFSARNHHEIGNPYFLARKQTKGEDSVRRDLALSAVFLDKISKESKVIVVESNHHEAFERWLRTAEGHRDPVNAEFWHEANARIFRSIRERDKDFDVYKWALTNLGDLRNVHFLKTDASYTICGVDATKNAIECGIHGHRGINGARGQSSSYRAIGRRVNVGHSHSAGIIDGVYTAGVSGALDMDYNHGPSSWSHSHIVTYANGKRAIVTIKNGKWRA